MAHSKKSNMVNFDYQQANPFCIECKPGYRASRISYMNMVYQCELIPNCFSGMNGKSFNACDECEQGYYFKYDTSNNMGGVDRSVCFQSFQNHDGNCFSFDVTAT